jgi:hypothetical protein
MHTALKTLSAAILALATCVPLAQAAPDAQQAQTSVAAPATGILMHPTYAKTVHCCRP